MFDESVITLSNTNFKLDTNELDNSQASAVNADGEKVLIKAPAGSGKTKTLISAIAKYRSEYLNDKINAITYTNAAKAEMSQRLAAMGVNDVQISTIHSWCFGLLQKFAKKYDFRIQVLQEKEIKAILRELVDEYVLRSKIKNINIDILYSFISGNKNMDIKDYFKRTLLALENRYIAYKKDNNLYDFTDYPQYLYDVLVAFNETIDGIDALFVDEFQDVDPIQFEIFKKTNTHKKFFIGDSAQSIYVFRGADGEIFNKLKGFKVFTLDFNYRSYQEIVNYASAVYDNGYCEGQMITDTYKDEISPIKCNRGYGGEVTLVDDSLDYIVISSNDKTCGSASQQFDSLLADNAMILCRTNKQVRAIQQYGYFNATTVHQAKGLEYDSVIVIDTELKCKEDLNVAYVALTRAKNRLMVANWNTLECLLVKKYGIQPSFKGW